MPSLTKVTKEEFDTFLKNYPRKLEADFYMDYWSFYDWSLSSEHTECKVAMEGWGDYYIRKEV